jgi:hypothetical protein
MRRGVNLTWAHEQVHGNVTTIEDAPIAGTNGSSLPPAEVVDDDVVDGPRK